jgi:hypothetical protein
MKGREVLLVVLVVAIALGSGLIGLILGRSAVAPESAAPGATVGGQAVATGTTRLREDTAGPVLFEIDGKRVYQGTVSEGNVILFYESGVIYQGANATGEALFTVDGNQMFVGKGTEGPKAYFVDADRIHEGDSTGTIVYRIDGERMREGATLSGDIVFQANKDLTGDVRFILPVLADGRF